MANDPLALLERWKNAGLIDDATAAAIREYEARATPDTKSRLGAAIAWGMGAVLIGAGVISFVASNWQVLSPEVRLLLVVALTAVFHLCAGIPALAPALRTALHGMGTAALGAGIALSGQIFNLDAGWNGWMLLWALGAIASWYLLRDWVQMLFVAALVPLWIHSEWDIRVRPEMGGYLFQIALWFAVGIAYILTRIRPLVWLGSLITIPDCIFVMVDNNHPVHLTNPLLALAVGILASIAALAWYFPAPRNWERGIVVEAAVGLICIAWLVGGWEVYLILGILYVLLCAWGVRSCRTEVINLGIAGFALSVLGFYISHALDLLGGSIGLIVLGVLMLAGGFLLERTRRRLVQESQ